MHINDVLHAMVR